MFTRGYREVILCFSAIGVVNVGLLPITITGTLNLEALVRLYKAFTLNYGNIPGHIGIHVPNVEKACERFEQLEIPFIKKPDTGLIKGIAFVQDPDGYWVEIFNPKNVLYGQDQPL